MLDGAAGTSSRNFVLPIKSGPTPFGPKVTSSLAFHQPVGVCALIPTWNFPLYITVQKIGPALATGCTMVVKPSPFGPLIDLLFAEVVEECDLPAGVFNVVTGQSPELGAATYFISPTSNRVVFEAQLPSTLVLS